MELYFLRHGLAGQHGDARYKDDSLRPLTDQGIEKLQGAAEGMHTLGLTFDAILSSPFVRAKQTAEIIAESYNIKNKKIHLTQNLLPPAAIKDLLKEVALEFPTAVNVLLVGHEPHLSEMIASLLGSKMLNIDFKKGGLCCLTIDGPLTPHAVLNWLLAPSQLVLMAKGKP